MKSLIKNFGILLLTLICFGVSAQEIERSHFPPREAGWWTLGINGGWAYQQSDVPTTLQGYGFGMTLAKNLYYQPGSAISFDARGRWLYSQTIGLDTKRSNGLENNTALNGERQGDEGLNYLAPTGPGYVFQNHKTHQFELGLEGVLTANRLRERTGIIASLYGGINADWYNTLLDQSNSNGIYDYSKISVDDSKSSIKSILRNETLDGIYETKAHGFENGNGKIAFMPSVGIELGYQFTPRFSMHVGHKATFAKVDDLDGELWDNNNVLTGDNDIHHYTNLGLQWIIDPHQKKRNPPIINVTRPGTNPYISRSSAGRVAAKIKYVNSKADVTCSVNGQPTSFSFNRGNMIVTFPLQYGDNEIHITATNDVGFDEETVIIYYGDNSTPPVVGSGTNNTNLPQVNITNPRNSNTETENDRMTIKANVRYVDNKNDIEFYVNGRRTNNFDYDRRSRQFSGAAQLREGRNEIEIIAQNSAGSDRDNTVIIFKEKAKYPRVNITTPSRSPYETTQSSITIRADLENVNSKSDVQFYVNGRERSLFDYDTRSGRFSADLNLSEGNNEIIVKGYNLAGDAQDAATVILKRTTTTSPTNENAPVVTITSIGTASSNPFGTNTSTCKVTLKATILNVKQKRDITLRLNGRSQSDFTFNTKTKVLSAALNLVDGRNEIIVRAVNSAGSDQDSESKNCDADTPPPPPSNKPQVTINSPSDNSTTSDGTAKLNARIKYVNQKRNIRVKVNGNTISNFSFSPVSGVVTANLNLENGNNTISVWGKNNDGTDEESIRVRYNAPSNPPTVDITSPNNNINTDSEKATIKAKILNINSKNDIRFTVNGRNSNDFSYSNASKTLTANVNLKEGNNTITVKATTPDGSDSDNVRIQYNIAKNPPTVDITTPNNNTTTDTKKATIKARVLNINSKNDIKFTVNGRNSNDFSYSNSSKTLTANVNLKEGNNTITVKATTPDGSDSDNVRIKYNAPKVLPTVKINSPANNSTTEKANATVSATIKNAGGKSGVVFLVNGKRSNSFNLRGTKFSSPITLQEGRNTIQIKVSNNDGNDQDKITVTYRPKVLAKPTVRFTNPSRAGSTARSKRFTVKARVKNVDRKQQIVLKMNGRMTNFDFDKNTGNIVAAVQLKDGNNGFSLEATNASGKTTAKTKVSFQGTTTKIQKPKITITSISTPAANPFNPNASSSTIIGTIQNIDNKNQITITHNGKKITDFTFNTRTKKFEVAISTGGNASNKVKITATNTAGSDTEEHTY